MPSVVPSITFAAPIIHAATATLQEQMPLQVAQFNAEGNAVQLDVPATYHFGGTDLMAAFPFPQIEVAAVEGRSGQWAVEQVEFDHDVKVNVVTWLEGDSGEIPTLYEQSLGLARCAIESLKQRDAFGPDVDLADQGAVFWRADIIPADPTSENREFRRWRTPVFIQFGLEAVERFA